MHRYFEEVVYARDLIRSGQFGEIHTVRMRNATPGAIMPWYYAILPWSKAVSSFPWAATAST